MNSLNVLAVGMFAFLLLFGCIGEVKDPQDKNFTNSTLKKFESVDQLKAYLKENQVTRYEYKTVALSGGVMPAASPLDSKSTDSSVQDYSTTNIQVAGVDEADFVKNDGKYLYILSGKKLFIVNAYPADNAKILSETEVGKRPFHMFVNGDNLAIFLSDYRNTTVIQYDISERSHPKVKNTFTVEGNYYDSRMINNTVYVIVNKPIYYWKEIQPPMVPLNSKPDVYYFDEPAYSYRFTTFFSFDMTGDATPKSKVFLMGNTQNLYVSKNNIYVTYSKGLVYAQPRGGDLIETIKAEILPAPEYKQESLIHRLEINNGKIEHKATGSVPGYVLNQFSMDEHNNYFRIATTVGNTWSSSSPSKNNVYVLDSNLNVTGKLENLAPGERIYSARFMGNRAYVVTFKQVDPLFVIDLKDPKKPKVLGKLKIPGYSDYLHPYDENHLMGIGKETIEWKNGALHMGIKLSLFDVSDVKNPKEISKYEIGDRGSDSYALRDHKAVLFSKKKNLLVIPVLVAEIDESKYVETKPWQYGEYVFQGAYVFNIDAKNGFQLNGKITHIEDESLLKSGYYYNSKYSVKRSIYMGNTLYTISDKKVGINDLSNFKSLKQLLLS